MAGLGLGIGVVAGSEELMDGGWGCGYDGRGKSLVEVGGHGGKVSRGN